MRIFSTNEERNGDLRAGKDPLKKKYSSFEDGEVHDDDEDSYQDLVDTSNYGI